jgi:hypothetical protein
MFATGDEKGAGFGREAGTRRRLQDYGGREWGRKGGRKGDILLFWVIRVLAKK